MSHPLDAANLVMDLDGPETCSATGGIYRYPDGRTVPDTCNALFNYPSRKLTVSFIEEPARSGNATLAHLEDFFGNVRSRARCKAPVSEGFKAMIGVAMAIQSFQTRRTVHWDPGRETISG